MARRHFERSFAIPASHLRMSDNPRLCQLGPVPGGNWPITRGVEIAQGLPHPEGQLIVVGHDHAWEVFRRGDGG